MKTVHTPPPTHTHTHTLTISQSINKRMREKKMLKHEKQEHMFIFELKRKAYR